MENKILLGALYKLKDGKSIDKIEEMLSKYVITMDFIKNPLIEDYDSSWCVSFMYVFENSLKETTHIYPLRILSYDDFLNNFELYMDKKKIYEEIIEPNTKEL